jgi:hypothetical protein
VLKPTRGRCFGNPPRQTESAYSPPCRTAFEGDNGGETWKNVNGDEVRVGFWHLLGMPAQRGPIPDSPQPDEDAAGRTARVIQQYFNQRYELYGRRVQLIATQEDPTDTNQERASAVHSDQQGEFAAVHLFYDYCDEVARRDLVCMNGNPYPLGAYAHHPGRFWSYQMVTDTTDQLLGEYTCKKLLGKNAQFAGGGQLGKPRKIGVFVESGAQNFFRKSSNIAHQISEQCGGKVWVTFDAAGNEPDKIASGMAQMVQEGVTTIIMESSASPALQAMSAADATAYQPEWVMFNSYGLDFNDSARLLPKTQVTHMFGMSGWEMPRPFEDTDCYRAYKTIDPAGAPDANFCNLLYIQLEHIVNGIQEAGPDLNPKSFEKGMFSMPLQKQRYPWSISGGYGPGDWSFVDSLVEMWWDPAATDPNGGEVGAFRYTDGGKRWRIGELDGETRVFHDGVRGYQAP